MNLDQLAFLASDAGAAALARLAAADLADAHTLSLLMALRKHYRPEQASALLELARLRRKAVDKFGADAARLYLTRDALEQASDPLARRYRAVQFPPPPGGLLVDLCCGVGADALAFAQAHPGARVLGLDLDPVRVAMARLNADALGLTNARFEVADVRDFAPPPGAALLFYDPARRDTQGKRIYDVERYQPPLSAARGWAAAGLPVLAKLSPGVDPAQLAPYLAAHPGWLAFISVGGDLKEALLCLNLPAPTPAEHPYQAVLLTTDDDARHYTRRADPPLRIAEPRGWLCEPDAAIIRAGLVRDLAAALDGAQLDESIAYFTTETLPTAALAAGWVRAWRVLDWLPFNLRKLRAYLREHSVGQVTVKKRGSPLEPDALIAQLKLSGEGEDRVLILTQMLGKPIVVICTRQDSNLRPSVP